jgi:divalent metal cation (Fe/Co/Zn/Cd) transporter
MRLAHGVWEFVVGDDWIAALAVVIAIALTAALGVWWFLPLAVVAILYVSLRRMT